MPLPRNILELPVAKKKDTVPGDQAFDAYFQSFFGNRWDELKKSFATEPLYRTISHEGCSEYHLDAASALAACCLPVAGAERILDMCAAPGGKSLITASRMDPAAELKSNEFSKDRYIRLKKNMETCIPQEISQRVTVTCFDAATWCKFEKDIYDAILLDAPCSSERHVWNDMTYLKQWTPARIRNLAMKQWSLLSSAFLCLKSGGKMLYATCALSPDENDGPVKKLLKKYPEASVSPVSFEAAEEAFMGLFGAVSGLKPEQTEFGYHVLPDVNNGAGPLYFCLIEKQ